MIKLKYGLRLIREIIYPRHCAVCKKIIDEGYFCDKCRRQFIMKKRIADEETGNIYLLFKYEQELQQAIHKLKFTCAKDYLPLLREEAEIAMPKHLRYFLQRYDIVTNIPTSAERLAKRGFDIPAELFGFLEKWEADVLIRVRNTLPLFDLEPALRREELQGCFAVNKSVCGKNILLCDDIYTTGSTVREAAVVLKAAGAKSVDVLAFSASKDNW